MLEYIGTGRCSSKPTALRLVVKQSEWVVDSAANIKPKNNIGDGTVQCATSVVVLHYIQLLAAVCVIC